ncbi:unnamed protein product [Schistosoma spindalis]|nr:unnamed protein product [Schistosoma spindale]
MKRLQSDNVTSNYCEHFNYTNDVKEFPCFYTSSPISLYPENSPVIMKDMRKSRKDIPTTIIAPDGYVPNSPIRVKWKPFGKKESSDENANEILSSIVSANNDLLIVNFLNKLPNIIINVKTEEIDNPGREAYSISIQSCRNVNKNDFTKEQINHLVEQIKRQTTPQYLENKIQGDINENGMKRKNLAESENQQETTQVKDNYLSDYIKSSDKKATQKKNEKRTSHTLPTSMVKTYLQQMSKEWGTLTNVMTVFHQAIKQDKSSIYLLDKYFQSTNIRVRMINTIISPKWTFLYLSSLVGNSEELMRHIDIMLNLKTTVDIMNSIKTKYEGYLGGKQHLDLFLSSFKTTRNILENHLINIGIHKEESDIIIYNAICNDNDTKQKIGNLMNIKFPQKLIDTLKTCNKKKLKILIHKSIKRSKSLSKIVSFNLSPLKRLFKDDNSLKKLHEDKIKKRILSDTIEQLKHSDIEHNKLQTLNTVIKYSSDDDVQTEMKSVDMIENAFTSVNKLQETVKQSNQFVMNNLTSKDTRRQNNSNITRLCKTLDIMFELDEMFHERKADELNKMQQNEMELQTKELIKFNKWRQTNCNKMSNEIIKITGSSSFNEKVVRLYKYSNEAFSKDKTIDKSENFDENVELFESSRDKLMCKTSNTSLSKHIKNDVLESNEMKMYMVGQQFRLSTPERTPQSQIKMNEFLLNSKEFLAKRVKELPKVRSPSLSLGSLELSYHDSVRPTKNGGNLAVLKRNIMASEATKMLISSKISLNKQRTPKKEEVNVIKAQYFTNYKENMMSNRQQPPKSTSVNLANSIINKHRFAKGNLTCRSEESLFETAFLTKSGPIHLGLFPVTSVQIPSKMRKLRKHKNPSRTPTFMNSVMNLPCTKSKQFKRQNSEFNFLVKTSYKLPSLRNKVERENRKLEVNKMKITNELWYRKQTLETSKIQIEPSLTIRSLSKMGSILTIQPTSSITSQSPYQVIQQKPHKTQKKAIKPSENPSDTDIRNFDLNFDTQNILQWFGKVLEANVISSYKQERLVPTFKLEKDRISVLKPLYEIYWGSSDVNQRLLKQPHFELMFKQKLLMELSNSLSIKRKQSKNKKTFTLPIIDILTRNVSYQTSNSKSMIKKQKDFIVDNVNMFLDDLYRILHYSQDKLSLKELTKIKTDRQNTSNTINLMYGCNDRTYEGSKTFHVDSEQHKISDKRANLPRIASHTCQPVHGKFHCRHEALARKRYQNLGLSISNHIQRVNLIQECMHKPNQQRSNGIWFPKTLDRIYQDLVDV